MDAMTSAARWHSAVFRPLTEDMPADVQLLLNCGLLQVLSRDAC
jgi:hypothetical protein